MQYITCSKNIPIAQEKYIKYKDEIKRNFTKTKMSNEVSNKFPE